MSRSSTVSIFCSYCLFFHFLCLRSFFFRRTHKSNRRTAVIRKMSVGSSCIVISVLLPFSLVRSRSPSLSLSLSYIYTFHDGFIFSLGENCFSLRVTIQSTQQMRVYTYQHAFALRVYTWVRLVLFPLEFALSLSLSFNERYFCLIIIHMVLFESFFIVWAKGRHQS